MESGTDSPFEMSPSREPELDVPRSGARAAVQLVGQSVATRGITLLGTLVLARILTPVEFGAFAVVTVAVTVISLAGDLGIGPALVQQKHPPSNLELSTALSAQLALWGTAAAIGWIVAGMLPSLRSDLPADTVGIARLLAAGLLLVGWRALPTIMLTRNLRFGPLAAIEVGQQLLYFGVAIALALSEHGIWSFAIAGFVQNVFATLAVYAAWPKWVGFRFDLQIARRLLRFGIGYQFGHILAWGRDAVVPVFGSLAGGLAAVGFLNFAWQNGQVVRAVEQIVARVAFPAFSRLQGDRQRLAALVTNSLEMSFAVVCIVQLYIASTAPVLVPVLFSDTWTPAVTPLQLVSIGALAGAPTYVLRSYMYSRGNSGRALVLTAFALLILLIAFPILAASAGLVGAAWSFVLSSAIGLLLFVAGTWREVAFPWRPAVRVLLTTALVAVPVGLFCQRIGGLQGLIMSGVIYLVAVPLVFWLLNPALVQRARRVLSSVRRGGALEGRDDTTD